MSKSTIKKITAGFFSAVLFIALTAFAFAADGQVEGVKAVSKTFRTVTLTWDEVVIEKPEVETTEPSDGDVTDPAAGPEGSGTETDPAGEMTDPTGEATDPAGEMTDPLGGATDPTEETTAPTEEATAQADPSEPEFVAVTYKVYRSTKKTSGFKLIATTEETSYKDYPLTPGKTYYYKIKAAGEGVSITTSPVVDVKVIKQKNADLTLIKKGGAAFNFRKEANQKLYKYDTLQGGCAYNGYAYLTLYNRNVEKCKIVKVNLNNLKVAKVSDPLQIYHANSLTYNTKKDVLVACCCQVKGKRLVTVNAKTLKVTSKKDIKLTRSIKNLPSKVRRKYQGFTALAYSEKNDCYVGRLRYSNNAIIFDNKLNPQKYIKLSGKKTYLLNQAMECYGNFIFDVRSFKNKHKYSMVTVHSFSGKFVGQFKVPFGASPGKELECVFHDGEQFYAGFYYSTSQKNDTKSNHVLRHNELYTFNNLTKYLNH